MKNTRITGVPTVFLWSIFAVSNSLLSYGNLSFSFKIWILLMGSILPFATAFFLDKAPSRLDVFESETIDFKPNPFLWAFFIFLFIFFRFYRLDSFHLWPTGDEGLHGFLAIPLVQKWNWQFFYTVGEHPPLLIWALVPFFKWIASPFFDLWFLPALFSALAVPAGYWACRQFGSRSLSFFFGFLFAFSFWPLFFGRFCHQGLFTPFWETAGLILLGLFLRSQEKGRRRWLALWLGLWIGLGSLTFTAWAVVIALFGSIVLVYAWVHRKGDRLLGPIFFFGLLLGCSPFITAAFQAGYGHHLVDTSAASHYFDTTHQWMTHLSYVTCLFWGSLQNDSSYAPSWGGVLNPLLTACFLLGLLELIRSWNKARTWWIFFGSFILFLPGLLSADYVEFNRVIQVMPFLLLVTAMGLQKLASDLSPHKQWILLPLLLGSFCLDMNHLLRPVVDGPTWKLDFKKRISNEGYEAYQILEDEYRQAGPGLILTDFMPLSHGHMLHDMTYHFNAAINPQLDPADAQWAAVIVNSDYQKALEKTFPGSVWRSVTSQTPELGGTVVGIIPVNSRDLPLVQRWFRAHRYFYDLNLQAENMYNDPKLYKATLEGSDRGYPLIAGDRFLESCFGEWKTQFHWGSDYRMNILLMQRTIQKGYPCAHLYFKLGQFYLFDHQLDEARRAFQKALQCQSNDTAAREWLAALASPKPVK